MPENVDGDMEETEDTTENADGDDDVGGLAALPGQLNLGQSEDADTNPGGESDRSSNRSTTHNQTGAATGQQHTNQPNNKNFLCKPNQRHDLVKIQRRIKQIRVSLKLMTNIRDQTRLRGLVVPV